MYSQDKISIALKVYHQCGAVTANIRVLSYPTRRSLYTCIANEGVTKSERKSLKLINMVENPRNPSVEAILSRKFFRSYSLIRILRNYGLRLGICR